MRVSDEQARERLVHLNKVEAKLAAQSQAFHLTYQEDELRGAYADLLDARAEIAKLKDLGRAVYESTRGADGIELPPARGPVFALARACGALGGGDES